MDDHAPLIEDDEDTAEALTRRRQSHTEPLPVLWRARALAGGERIVRYIAADNPIAAKRSAGRFFSPAIAE